VKFIIMQFSPRSVFLPFRSKYPPQHSVFKNPQSVFLLQNERPSFTPIQHNWQYYYHPLSKIILFLVRALTKPRACLSVLRRWGTGKHCLS